MKNVIVIGAGLSGMITAIQLANAGISCTILERKHFPLHKVCGEYISNETVPFLKSLGLYPEEFNPPIVQRLQLTSVNGKSVTLPLDLGGFGISRYSYDYFLFEKATKAGVNFSLETEVEKITFDQELFKIFAGDKIFTSDIVIGSFGKRSKIDISMERDFIKKRSPYLGVKYHIRIEHPRDLIALHNFKAGYCGISNIENDKTNLCYLTHRDNLKKYGNIRKMEEAILFRNPFIKTIFNSAEFLFDKPETINEISFETKRPVEDHVLMTGDAAGMITPLCGNGMAMAIHSSKILSEILIPFCKSPDADRNMLEQAYTVSWHKVFANRLRAGRQIQKLFGKEWTSNLAVNVARYARPVANFLVNKTHGEVF